MAPALPSTIALRAVLALISLLSAFAVGGLPELPQETAEETAICLMQSRASLMPPRQGASEATAGDFDASFFAQTAVEVSTETLEKKVPAADAELAWLSPTDTEQPVDDMMCSAEGLTPGVCAMKALARTEGAPAGSAELDYLDTERLERALFQELDAALKGTHDGFSQDHLLEVEEELASLYAALPKNSEGLLDHATVRYAVHQRFVRKRAWYIRSLNPVGEAQTPASAGEAMRGKVPEHLQRLIEQRQDGRGLGLRELSALATTLEHLIDGDLAERLKAVYGAHGLAYNQPSSRSEVLEVLKTHMAHFLSLRHRSGYAVTPEQAKKERDFIEGAYPGWGGVVGLIEKALESRAPQNPGMTLSFSDALSAANEVMAKFEQTSAQECLDIKEELSAMPNGASGRVLLTDLRRKALNGEMQFAESTEYLAVLGALEENERGSISVLVPNYVYSPSNCLGTTSFFDLCCPSECEIIMDQLEMNLRKPDATPVEVHEVIDSIRAEGPLSGEALEDLDALAHKRDGKVPLHGLLFQQWLHRAFPKECPKPRAEDFAGAPQEAEVPAGRDEFQDVAKLPSMTSSKSDLLFELEQEAEEQQAEEEQAQEVEEEQEQEVEEGQELEAIVEPPTNASKVTDGARGGLRIAQLKAIAAEKLSTGWAVKMPSTFDAASLAQTQLDVSTVASASQEQKVAEQGTSGLNIKRRP